MRLSDNCSERLGLSLPNAGAAFDSKAMKVEADAYLDFPRELVFETYRDRLPELVPHLPDVERITVESREEEGAIVRLVNRWQARAEVPKVARSIVKPEMMVWLDHATWDQDAWTVEWRIEHATFAEQVRCGGLNHYVADGDRTRLEIRGDLSVDAARIPGIPRMLAGTVAPVLERFIVGTIRPNLVSTADGVQAFLRSQERPDQG
jgi:hypothetical protein